MRVPMLDRTCVDFARNIGWHRTCLLQQSYVGLHLQ